jgi:hypothetical protein
MKKMILLLVPCCLLLAILSLPKGAFSQNVGIGTTAPNTSAMLDVQSTNKGLLPPRMTTIQRDAIVNPSSGLIIFNTTTQSIQFFTDYGWSNIKFSIPGSNSLLGGNQLESVNSIEKTTDGGYIVAALCRSSSSFDVTGTNHGLVDFWIFKLDRFGKIIWNKLLGGDSNDSPFSIQQTTDGGYIVAGDSYSSANGDVTGTNHGPSADWWIVKLDGSGNIIWNKLLGGNDNDNLCGILQTSDGGYIVGGSSQSSANGDVTGITHGFVDYWVVKLDASGNIVWNKLYGGNDNDKANSIQLTSDGGFIIAGESRSSATGDVTGINHGGINPDDYWIVKLNASGNIVWNKLYGGNNRDLAKSVQQTSDGGFIIAGSSQSSANGNVTGINHGFTDYWVVKLDASGNIVWNKLYGGNSDDTPNSIAQTSDGGYVIAGFTNNSFNGNITAHSYGVPDFWIIKLDGSGNIIWDKLYGGAGNDQALTILQTSGGGLIVAGYSYSNRSGNVIGDNHGVSDCWILRLDSSGNILQNME